MGEDRLFERGFFAALDHIAGFINSLDSADMTGKQVRTAIYSECLTARPNNRAQKGDDEREAVERLTLLSQWDFRVSLGEKESERFRADLRTLLRLADLAAEECRIKTEKP